MKSRGFFLRSLLEKINKAHQAHDLFRKNDRLVIGLSGGADSSALLLALATLRRKYNFSLVAAHLNHGLQGARGQKFERLAKKISDMLNVPFYSKKIALRMIAQKTGRSLEEAGRVERYGYFSEVAQATGSSKIATAHTLDDQAETVLLRILRGSGLRGLSAIPFRRREGRLTLIRPLLLCQKKELLAVLKEARIRHAEDPTNNDEAFTRNRIRSRLLPFLEKKFNPQIKEALSALQSASSAAQDFIEKAAEKAFKKCGARRPNKVVLKIKSLKNNPPAVRSEVLCRALMLVRGDLKRVTHKHLETLESFLSSSETNLELCLPGTHIRKTKLTLDFYPR